MYRVQEQEFGTLSVVMRRFRHTKGQLCQAVMCPLLCVGPSQLVAGNEEKASHFEFSARCTALSIFHFNSALAKPRLKMKHG